MRLKLKVILSLALVLTLLFFLLGSALSPAYETGHSCIHSDCAVCDMISAFKYLSGMLCVALLAVSLYDATDPLCAAFCADKSTCRCTRFTPVALKDKLSD